MTIIEQLKCTLLEARRAKDPICPSISFFISEIEKVGKNNGNRLTTEDEAIRVVRKLAQSVTETLSHAIEKTKLEKELALLNDLLPKNISNEELKEFIKNSTFANKGVAMKSLKEKYGALVDMKQAGIFLNEIHGI